MFSELTVIIKDDDGKSLRKKFPIYVSYAIEASDPVVKECVEECLRNFGAEATSIAVKVHLQID